METQDMDMKMTMQEMALKTAGMRLPAQVAMGMIV